MKSSHQLTCATVAVVSTLLLMGCAGPDTSADQSSSAQATASPIDAYLEAAVSKWDEAQATRFVKREEALAACMSEKGFTYYPSAKKDQVDESEADRNTESWVSENGYGLAVGVEPGAVIPGDLPGGYADEASEENARYLKTLSVGELDAYSLAMYGRPAADPNENKLGVDPSAPAVEGCLGAEQNADPVLSAAGQALAADREKLRADATADPEWVAAESEWASCMATAGYEGLRVQADGIELIGSEYGALSAGPSDDSATDGQRTREIAVALADFRCVRETGYLTDTAAVEARLEQVYVDTHQKTLDEVITAYQAAS